MILADKSLKFSLQLTDGLFALFLLLFELLNSGLLLSKSFALSFDQLEKLLLLIIKLVNLLINKRQVHCLFGIILLNQFLLKVLQENSIPIQVCEAQLISESRVRPLTASLRQDTRLHMHLLINFLDNFVQLIVEFISHIQFANQQEQVSYYEVERAFDECIDERSFLVLI